MSTDVTTTTDDERAAGSSAAGASPASTASPASAAGRPPSPSDATKNDAVARRHKGAKRRKSLRQFGARTAAVLAVIAAWWIVTAAGWIDPLFLPGPGAVVDALVNASTCHPVSSGSARQVCGEQGYFLWEHVLASLKRIAIGVSLATVVGVALGFLMGEVRLVRTMLDPFVNFLRSLPPLGYIGLLIVWFGIGDSSKIWLLFLAAFPPITVATISGIDAIREDRLHAIRSLGANRRQTLWHVVLPSSLPNIVGGVRIAVGFAWTTVVSAELNNGIPGIGGLAYLSGTQLQTALTIGCILVIGVLAIALDASISLVGRLLVPWHGKA